MSQNAVSAIALLGGALLSLMVFLNASLAYYLGPVQASLVVHIVGSFAALILFKISYRSIGFRSLKNYQFHWSHMVGFFGAFAVALIGYTVNTDIGISGTVGSAVLGQIVYGWFSDYFGFFGSGRKKPNWQDTAQAIFLLLGVGLLINA
ncbi:MAG: DMT family transporter [Bdellovibrionota bacterium]|nr:DMT family transporter [Bdellovibrionota bacterium]